VTKTLWKKAPSRLAELERLPEIAHVSRADRRRLLDFFNEVRVPAGTTILDAGDRIEHLYLVADGTVSTTTDDGTLVLHGPGEPVALRSLLRGEQLEGAIVAVTEVELWTMGRRELLTACMDTRGFALGLLERAG
jgi:CRP-like cAMP-binding protein